MLFSGISIPNIQLIHLNSCRVENLPENRKKKNINLNYPENIINFENLTTSAKKKKRRAPFT